MSKNDITGDRLVSKVLSEEGRDNWDRIFGKKEHLCKFCGQPTAVDPADQTPPADICHNEDHGE